MSRAFAISTGSHTLNAGSTRTGSASFTISNSTGKTVDTRVSISAMEECQETWLSIDGNRERAYTEKDTQQYTVKYVIPPEVKPGAYRFRLDIYAVENPDEIYSEGPVVEINVSDAEKPIDNDHPFPWWIVAVVAVVLIAGGGIGWWATHRTPAMVTVDDVMGKTHDEAREILSNNGFEIKADQTQLTVETDEVDRVIGQDPLGNTQADHGSTVTLTFGKLGAKVPKTVGDTLDKALDKMNRAGFYYQVFTDSGVKKSFTEYRKRASALTREGGAHLLLKKPAVPEVTKTVPSSGKLLEKNSVVKIYTGTETASIQLKGPDIENMGINKDVINNLRIGLH